MTPPRPARETRARSSLQEKKAKWIALYRRLMARMTALPALRFEESATSAVFLHTTSGSKLALIRIGAQGIEVGLRLSRSVARTERLIPSKKSPLWITHRVLIASPSEIDEEFLAWVKVARLQAGNAKSRSTSRERKT